MREDDQNVVGHYLICVDGKSTSSYRLQAYQSNDTHMLQSGVSESGYL